MTTYTTYRVQMAKASQQDIDKACELAGMLKAVRDGWYPTPSSMTDKTKEPSRFDPEDSKHLRTFYRRVMAHSDGLWRVVGCCSTLLHQNNAVLNPDADVLELHPRIAKALALVDGLQAGVKRDLTPPEAVLRIGRTAFWRRVMRELTEAVDDVLTCCSDLQGPRIDRLRMARLQSAALLAETDARLAQIKEAITQALARDPDARVTELPDGSPIFFSREDDNHGEAPLPGEHEAAP